MTTHDPHIIARAQARIIVDAARPDQIERLLRDIRAFQPDPKRDADA